MTAAQSTVRRSLPKAMLWSTGLVTCAFGVIGFAHTEAGRPLLNALRGAPGCPVSLDAADPADVEAYRIAQLSARRGVLREASRPALAFELGKTRRAEVMALLDKHGARCESVRQDSVLRCAEAPDVLSPAGAPRIDDLHLQFDGQQRLVAVDLFRASSDGRSALAWLDALDAELCARVGPATRVDGQPNADYLAQRSLRRTSKHYRYRGYVAQVSATNFGSRGVRVREQYQWLPDGLLDGRDGA